MLVHLITRKDIQNNVPIDVLHVICLYSTTFFFFFLVYSLLRITTIYDQLLVFAVITICGVNCKGTAVIIFGFAVVDTHIVHQYGEAEATGSLVGDMLIISTCVFLCMVAVFGCFGVLRNSVKFLYLYTGFLMILVVLELLVGIYVALQRFGLEYKIIDILREDFYRNGTNDHILERHQHWEYLQTTYECCGLNGPEDYPALSEPISLSCCPRAYRARSEFAQKQLYRSCLVSGTYYSEGCEDAILYALRDSADCMMGIASMGFWFEITGMVLATLVTNNLKTRVQIYKETTKY